MREKAFARLEVIGALLVFVAILGIAQGCSEEDQERLSRGEVTAGALALRTGESVDEVKEKLRQPVTEFIEENGDGALNYPGWQIAFRGGELTRRIREVGRRLSQRGDGERLRREVLGLERGMSAAQAQARLGEPDVSYLYYEEDDPPEKVFRYGPWELRFSEGGLSTRTHW